MPGLTARTAQVVDYGPVEDRSAELDNYTVSITTFREHLDGAPMLRGLPNDNCSCPHWGYVLEGEITFHFPDHDEAFLAGEAFYVAPGHTPEHAAGSRVLFFSPTEELKATKQALTQGLQEP